MSNNTTVTLPYSVLGLCSFDGVPRERTLGIIDDLNFSISIIIALMSPVAVTGNALILITIWKYPSLRTASSIFLCGLAFTDLCTGLLTQPFLVATELLCLKKPQEIEDRVSFLVFAKVISEGCGTYFAALTVLVMTFMSIERWLHMSTRRSLVTMQRVCMALVGLLLLPIPVAVFRSLQVLAGTQEMALDIIIFVVLLLCLLATAIAYYKVFRIIRHHQQQVQASNSSQNSFAQPAINLAKYKKSVVSILYIVVLFYISYLPFLVFLGVYSSLPNQSEIDLAFLISNIFFFLSSSLNPFIYLCRMNDIRNGAKQLLKQLYCGNN